MSAPCKPPAHVGENVEAEPLDAGRQERRGRDEAHARAERREKDHVRARDARMHDVAADRDDEAFDPPLVAADRERVEKRLGRMLVGAVAGIDDRAVDHLREKMHGARRVMAHDDDVRPHGVEGRRRVDERLALLHGGRGDRHVHHVGAEPLAGDLEGRLRSRRGLEEEIDLRAAAQGRLLLLDLAAHFDLLVGEIEQRLDVQCRKALDPEQVAVGKNGALRCAHVKLPPIGGVDRHGKLARNSVPLRGSFLRWIPEQVPFASLSLPPPVREERPPKFRSFPDVRSAAENDPGSRMGKCGACHSGAAKRNPEPINTDMSGRGGPSCTFLERQRLPAPLARPGLTGGKRLEQWTATHEILFQNPLWTFFDGREPRPAPSRHPSGVQSDAALFGRQPRDVEPTRSSTRCGRTVPIPTKAALAPSASAGGRPKCSSSAGSPTRTRRSCAPTTLPGSGSTWSNSIRPITRSCGRASRRGCRPPAASRKKIRLPPTAR